jgi:hypothetical protein
MNSGPWQVEHTINNDTQYVVCSGAFVAGPFDTAVAAHDYINAVVRGQGAINPWKVQVLHSPRLPIPTGATQVAA